MESIKFATLFYSLMISLMLSLASANVVLIGHNVTRSFDDIEANFAPTAKGSGECGRLYLATPLDACSPIVTKTLKNSSSPFALIIRGGCSFEDKVRRAQVAGFKAAIVYDNEDDGVLVAMAGNPEGIKIHAVFVSKASGEILKKYAGIADMELWIIPSFENSAWSIMAISFISLLAMSAVLATCFFIRRHRVRRERPRASRVREFHGMSSRLVKAMPSLIFTSVLEDNCTSRTCAICLEDYSVGEKIRVLPCRHKFHAKCVDSWLTAWRSFCPVCKRDARTTTGEPPASESTPLLSSTPVTMSSSSLVSSSFRSSIPSPSSAIQIMGPSTSRSPSISRSGTPYIPNSLHSYHNHHHHHHHHHSPSISASRSSVDLRNASSQRSQPSYLVSAYSLGYPSLSPLNSSRYMSPYVPSPSNASSYVGSSSQQHPSHPLRYSESNASFSPFDSAHSLPGC